MGKLRVEILEMWIRKSIVTVDVFYYIPDYTLVQEFIWQTEDLVPDVPRVHKFLNYWRESIDATIQQVLVSYSCGNDIRKIDLQVTYDKFSRLPH